MKKILHKIKIFALMAVCVALFISFACLYNKKESVNADNENIVLNIWQIDSFEGGKGSRSEFLQNIGNAFGKKENCYVKVVSLSADAARLNLSNGSVPDLVSYGAGIYGIENYVNDFTVWCRGGYCIITLDTNSDFSDVIAENTVINRGKDNFSGVAALFCGLQNCKAENSTAAYVKLINGEYKYMLGTQRDIFRLKTREVGFAVKPVTGFNDLYQNISITSVCKNSIFAKKYIDFLLSKNSELNKIGLFSDGINLYDDEMHECENISFDYRITYPINKTMKDSIEKCVADGDINMLKELLK